LLKHGLRVLGNALLVIVGVGYGVAKALDAFDPESRLDDFAQKNAPRPRSSAATDEKNPVDTEPEAPSPKPAGHPPAAGVSEADSRAAELADTTIQRLDRVEERLSRLESSIEVLIGPASGRMPARHAENLVTRTELSAAMEQFSSTLDTDIERRFDIQNRSVQSLRTMVARTDELLEQVLERIEAASMHA